MTSSTKVGGFDNATLISRLLFFLVLFGRLLLGLKLQGPDL